MGEKHDARSTMGEQHDAGSIMGEPHDAESTTIRAKCKKH